MTNKLELVPKPGSRIVTFPQAVDFFRDDNGQPAVTLHQLRGWGCRSSRGGQHWVQCPPPSWMDVRYGHWAG